MRNFISIFAMFALIVTTTITPAVAKAAPHADKKVEQTAAPVDHDCHGHGEKSATDKTAQKDKDGAGHCCDKGICKCVGGTCHNSLSKILGDTNLNLATAPAKSLVFALDNQFVDSALAERLKRPPRA